MIWDAIWDIRERLIILFLNFINGKKTVIEGDFTIVSKNKSYIERSFVLESDTKERYVVYVSDTVYQLYFINDKIKATFETYSKSDTCRNLKVEGIVASE